MNKNWNDRADKDLFFTILSVKNIGVISGSEWTTIGNHMRSLGYGFTNEGCRQHFQGLRRAAHRADVGAPPPDTTRKVDPTLNPITRRPGPGRGRPRKSIGADTTQDSLTGASLLDEGYTLPPLQGNSQPLPSNSMPHPGPPMQHPTGLPTHHAHHAHSGHPEGMPLQGQEGVPMAPLDSTPGLPTPHDASGTPKAEGLADLESDNQGVPPPQSHLDQDSLVGALDHGHDHTHGHDHDDDDQGPPMKRQRMEEPDDEPSQAMHEDEAVLALAAHNGGSNVDSVDPYASEYPHPDPGHHGGLDGDTPFDAYGDP